MKVGIFGGTFDPFHKGHEKVLKTAANSGYFDKIYVTPNSNPPHKLDSLISLSSYRYEIARIAIENINFKIPVIINDIEMTSLNKTYTLHTINHFKRSEPKNEFSLICGSDVLFDLERWYKPEELLKSVELFIAKRPGYLGTTLIERVEVLKENFNAKITFFDTEYIDISSSELRALIMNNRNAAREYIPQEVYDFISQNKIYDSSYDLSNLNLATHRSIKKYEKILFKKLNHHRLIHSLNTMREAVKLCDIFDVNINAGAIAGLLHDCAKYANADSDVKLIASNANENEKLIFDNDDHIFPEIRHAYWGEFIAKYLYGVFDKDILNSIYYHTTSRSNSSLLEIIVFVADKIEPGRKFPRIDKLRKISYNNINAGHYECLSDIIRVLENRKLKIHNDTIEAFNSHETKGGQ